MLLELVGVYIINPRRACAARVTVVVFIAVAGGVAGVIKWNW